MGNVTYMGFVLKQLREKLLAVKICISLVLSVMVMLGPFVGDCSAMGLTEDTVLQYCPSEPVLWKGGTVATLDATGLVLSGVLAKDTSIRYCSGESTLFKGGTRVTFQAAPSENRCQVFQGTLAQDTALRHNVSGRALFKGGTQVTFQTSPLQNRCLVRQGTLAEDTKIYRVGNVGSPTVYKAGTTVTLDDKGLVTASSVNPVGPGPVNIPQKGTMIFDNFNGETVHNKPYQSTVFTLNKPAVITSIRNYHWNSGRGASAGEIWLIDQSGRRYGPWKATGVPGSGGAQNAYWVVSPRVKIASGTYTIRDSDSATWSQNSSSQGMGMSQVEGLSETSASAEHTPPVTTSPVTTPPVSTPQKPPVTTPPVSATPKPPVTTSPVSTPPKSPQQGGGWHMEGAPVISKAPFKKDDCNSFGFNLTLSDGSANGAMSWKDCSNQTKCSGTYTGSVSWSKPPAYMKPGSKISFTGTARTSANNTCGYRNIGSGVTLRANNGTFLDVIESRSPSGTATYTVPAGSQGSKMTIEVIMQAAGLHGKVTYNYVYK